MARIYDNINEQFVKGLQNIISAQGVKRVDFCVGFFNLRGWKQVVNYIDTLPGDYVDEGQFGTDRRERYCRLLIGMHLPDKELIRRMYGNSNPPDADYVQQCKLQIAREFREQLQIGMPTAEDEWTLRRLANQLREGKVCVKLSTKEPLHAKLYLAYRPEDNFNQILALMGSSNLTYAGLTKQGELDAEFGDSDQAEKFARWFEDRWEDRFSVDITDELLKAIEESWASEELIPPFYIYLKTAYNLSREARSGVRDYALSPEFRKQLFEFQQTAVKIATKHLMSEKRGGAMIGDVVGLGKTITACAIAKIFEMNYGSTTLVICPAPLQDMWKKYAKDYDLKLDIISKDKRIDVDAARFYRLIIIDESHNLRNPRGARYKNIRELIQHQDSKVLLLTATPYNMSFRDLSAQLKLFISEDTDLGIRPEAYIRSIGGERQFALKHNDIHIRSIRAFEQSDKAEDWNDLMKLFLVRRTRTFIKNNYAQKDPENNRYYLQFPNGAKSYFPTRTPKSITFKTENGDQYRRMYGKEMIALMEELQLPRYGLSAFINEAAVQTADPLTAQQIDNLSRAGKRMMGFCKSTFFKRMDSSGFSFLLSLYRHILRNALFIYAIENKKPIPIGNDNTMPEDYVELEDRDNALITDDEDTISTDFQTGCLSVPTDMGIYMRKAEEYYRIIEQKSSSSTYWIETKYFKRTLKGKLLKDCEILIKMINLCGAWNPKNDQKLNKLESDILLGLHRNDKVLVFTQYADTAKYICEQIRRRGNITAINYASGASENPTRLAEYFSPMSNHVNVAAENELRVLVATDVLSEGQNLQDAHVIVNYDLPWAIIRLIQRAGRVDRIGQKADEIFCYSFFPAEGIEDIISLRERLNTRINENAAVVGSDEVFFEGNAQNLRDLYNEKSGVLDEEDDGEVDLESEAYQIWTNAINANPELAQKIPALADGVYSTKLSTSSIEQGVITYARTYNDFDMLTWLSPTGEIISQSQRRILRNMACSLNTPAQQSIKEHHNLVAKALQNIQDTSNTSFGGVLGNHFSTKYRIVKMLEEYLQLPIDMFVTEERKQLVRLIQDDIYNNPMVESTKAFLTRMLKNSRRDDIIDFLIEQRQNGTLCHVDKDNTISKEPKLICSMGLTSEQSVSE